MSQTKPELLNLERALAPLLPSLAGLPHEIRDTFGRTLSSHAAEQASPQAVDVRVDGVVAAKLRAPAGWETRLQKLLEAELASEFRAAAAESRAEGTSVLADDLASLLALSERETLSAFLTQALRLLRTHVWAERAVIFGMLDGFTLEGLTALGWPGDEWKSAYATAAGAAASTKKPHFAEDVVCLPLLHGETVLGVLGLAQRVDGPFTEDDVVLAHRFGTVLAHALQKHALKTRMEEFGRTKDHLGKYLSKKVVQNVARAEELQLGGVEKKVVCLFSDIRGYTTITEGIPAATLVQLLNFHFERMHAIIEKNEGTLDKIVGDLIMAVWNIPKDQPEPELLAMKAALEMQKEVIRIVAPEWQRHGVEKMGMGVGVNAGRALVGNLGSSRFMNYTVIGDAINTAQRLETKARAGEIWMNEEMHPLVHGKIEKPVRREVDIQLKGKEQTINALVYRPLTY